MISEIVLFLFFILLAYFAFELSCCVLAGIRCIGNAEKSGGAEKFGFAYIDKDLVPSVRNLGYLSIEQQLSKGIINISDVKKKYHMQHEEAIAKYPDCPVDIIDYLDWREPNTEQGSKAIYYLFAPIPEDSSVMSGIKKTRHDFLKNKVLVKIPIDGIEYVIEGELSPDDYRGKSTEYWIDKWKTELSADSGQPQLWFERIPHGMIVPKSGKVLNVDLA